MKGDIELKGLKKLDKALKRLGPATGKKVVFSAGRRALGLIKKKASRILTTRFNIRLTGKFTIRRAKYVQGAKQFSLVLMPHPKKFWFAKFLEFGTKPHKIKTKNKKAIKIDENTFRRTAQHPGISPAFFMRGGYDSEKENAARNFMKTLGDKIEKEFIKR